MPISEQEYTAKVISAAKAGNNSLALELGKQWQSDYPSSYKAHSILGQIQSRADKRAALASLTQALQLGENHSAIIILAAQCALDSREYTLAKQLIQRLSGQLSGQELQQAAQIYGRLSDFAAQEKLLTIVAKANQLDVNGKTQLAECLIKLGKITAAEHTFRSVLQSAPGHQKALFELSRISHDTNLKTQIEKALAASGNGSDTNTIFLHYALGNYWEKSGSFKAAFNSFQTAGAQAKRLAQYRVEQDISRLTALTRAADALECVPETLSTANCTPIFITGLPRSGTTIVERILSNSEQVESINETFFFSSALQECADITPAPLPKPADINTLTKAPLEQVGERYLELTKHLRHDAPFFIEKLPDNALLLGFIAKALPNAKIIYVHKNPLDSCFGLYKQPYFPYAYDLTDLQQYYVAHHQLMARWRSMLGSRLIEVGYEDLVKQPQQTTANLCQQLDVKYHDMLLNIEQNNTVSNSASASQISLGIYQTSLDRWHHYRSWLTDLETAFKQAKIEI